LVVPGEVKPKQLPIGGPADDIAREGFSAKVVEDAGHRIDGHVSDPKVLLVVYVFFSRPTRFSSIISLTEGDRIIDTIGESRSPCSARIYQVAPNAKESSMKALSRRTFIKSGAVCAALGTSGQLPSLAAVSDNVSKDREVHFLFDGLALTPLEYSQLLVQIAKERGIKSDSYLAGGDVHKLEATFAKILGKESAVFVPTGTLANHLALRVLSEEKSRVLVQSESHIYCDSLDCVETLSHLNLIPLAEDRATFSLKEVEAAVKKAANGPYPLKVGAISIECPVRRKQGQVFNHEEMIRVSQFAREHGIKMHLDGARLFIASAYTGIAPAKYATLFDTVYISLYKYFNAATGAVLAGPTEVIERVAHARKVFGGGLLHAWPYTAVALHYADGFLERFRKAVAAARALFDILQKTPGFHLEPIPEGTNICRLQIPSTDGARYAANLKEKGILISPPRKNTAEVLLFVNESLNRRPPEELARAFVEAIPKNSIH
jgi:threonine aldolase